MQSRCVPWKARKPRRRAVSTASNASEMASSNRPPTFSTETRFVYARPMSSTSRMSSAMAIACREVGERLVDLAAPAAGDRAAVERVALDLAGSGRTSKLDSLVRERPRLAIAVLEVEDLREAGERAGARLEGRPRRDEPHGRLMRLQGQVTVRRRSTRRARVAPGATRRGPGRSPRPPARAPCGGGPPPALGSLKSRDARRRHQHVHTVGVGPRHRRRDAVPQLQRSLVPRERLGERVAHFGRVGGAERGIERARQVVRGIPVIGELRRDARVRGQVPVPSGRRRLDRPGERGMQPSPLAGQQVVVDRIPGAARDGTRSAHLGSGVRDEDLVRDRLAQGARRAPARPSRWPPAGAADRPADPPPTRPGAARGPACSAP